MMMYDIGVDVVLLRFNNQVGVYGAERGHKVSPLVPFIKIEVEDIGVPKGIFMMSEKFKKVGRSRCDPSKLQCS